MNVNKCFIPDNQLLNPFSTIPNLLELIIAINILCTITLAENDLLLQKMSNTSLEKEQNINLRAAIAQRLILFNAIHTNVFIGNI